MITLTHNTTTIELPADMLWMDEFTWQPVAQSREYTLTGAMVVQNGTRLAGRPITLKSGDRYGWITRSTLDTLMGWAAVAGLQMTMVIRGVTHTVIFAHDSPPAIDVEMVFYYANPDPSEDYIAALKFITV